MSCISVEKDGLLYKAEYFYSDNLVTVFGEKGQACVETNGLTEQTAARIGLLNLIRESKIYPIDNNN